MKIEIERSGGFAGLIKTITVDTKNLPECMANNIEKHFSEIRLFNRASNTMKNRIADCYFYKISTKVGNRKQEIKFDEFNADKELKKVVNYLFKNYN